jgi:GAF domain-containing protein
VKSEEIVKRMTNHVQALPGLSLAAKVIESKKLRSARGVSLTKHASDVAAEAGEMIIAPIEVEEKVEGILDLRTKKGVKFTPQAEAIAGSISTLLALQMARDRSDEERLNAEKLRFETQSRADRELADNERALRDAFKTCLTS